MKRQRGMSIIELLIGVLVGFIVVAGAVKLMVDTLGSNRRLLLETRVNQDLRAAADLIARDIRRAGYWSAATSGIFSTTGSAPSATNPYVTIALDTDTPNENSIGYQYQRTEVDAGFRVSGGVLQFRSGTTGGPANDGWQAITDPKVITITNLSIALGAEREAELFTYCSCLAKLTCAENDFKVVSGTPGTHHATRPRLVIRQYDIVLGGQSVTDPAVQRVIRETVRVRNDRLVGNCPPA